MSLNEDRHEKLTYEAVVRALFENYECLYAVDEETTSYSCLHESDSYSLLKIETEGERFFEALEKNIPRTVFGDDQSYVRKKLSAEALSNGLKKDKYYSFVYRLIINDRPVYHKLRATRDKVDGRYCYLIGVRNIDAAYRQDKAHTDKISSLHRKEINHLEAILASAEGYFEANLTKDSILEMSPYAAQQGLPEELNYPKLDGSLSYSGFEKWRADNLIIENKQKYMEISDRSYLIDSFKRGDRRASVSFSMRAAKGRTQPCRKVFYLYADAPGGDVMAFCVLYDLTRQQKRDKELKDLENELRLSRIRNFTGQMQPHFLYNALGSIQEIILEDPKYASELLGDFTIHLRSCIRVMSNDTPIPFSQELKNISAYVNIEKMRFGGKLRVIYDIKTDGFNVLPLSIQPLVENAIRHGIYNRGEQGGSVYISAREDESSYMVTVTDDGVGFDVEKYENDLKNGLIDSTGLKNISFRLEKMLNASVKIESRVGMGTKITVRIPKEANK